MCKKNQNIEHSRTCISRSHPGPCLFVTWRTRQKTATCIETDDFTHAYCLEQNARVAALELPLTDATVTCCAVSILSFSMSSIWKPLRRTSSVEAGTVAVKGDCKDRDERLHKSSIGSCKVKQGYLSSEQHTHNP